MKLGIIPDFKDGSWDSRIFEDIKAKDLDFIELCIDVGKNVDDYMNNDEILFENLKRNGLFIGSVGRWGTERILPDGSINKETLEDDCKLICWSKKIGCGIFVTGCNYISDLSLYDNCSLAIKYFGYLLEEGRKNDVKIAVYTCRWNNFVHSSPAWDIILGHLKELYIKYDISHCFCENGDYLDETKKWGHRFAHVHIKGCLVINGKHIDDPPAGMDMINWPAFVSTLYSLKYSGNLSIEPHSANWRGEKGNKGVDYTINYFKNMIFD